MSSSDKRLFHAGQLHRTAIDAFIARARAVPEDRWNAQRDDGGWSPSQVTSHLILAYEALIRELGGEGALRIRTKWWQRLLLYFTVRRNILAGKPFPRGVRAPREITPPAEPTVQSERVALLAERSLAFSTLLEAHPRASLTHPFLGTMNAPDALRFCAAHADHHRQQLPE